jgi:hypothetical protein
VPGGVGRLAAGVWRRASGGVGAYTHLRHLAASVGGRLAEWPLVRFNTRNMSGSIPQPASWPFSADCDLFPQKGADMLAHRPLFSRVCSLVVVGVCVGVCFGVTVAMSAAVADDDVGGHVAWKRIQLDETFRAEGVTAFDVNKDGRIDVVNGEVWFEAPDWKMHEIRKPGTYDGAKGYSHSFAVFNYDLNGDGWNDIINIDFPGEMCYWFENPQGQYGHWKRHDLYHSAANESPQFTDITGDGKPELVMASEPEGMIGYLEIPSGDAVYRRWDFVAVNVPEPKVFYTHRYYHGLGVGDLNNDGRKDLIIPHGWFEQPPQLNNGPWKFHEIKLGPGDNNPQAAADIHVADLDGDGDNDVMLSSAHAIGVWWCENIGGNESPRFVGRVISDEFSQSHALCFQDIDRDGTPDLVTGKRFYAHGPNGDPNPGAEVVVYWFKLEKGKMSPPKFTPMKIVEGIDTGVGTQFVLTDLDQDGRLDIVLSNKKGTNILMQVAR